MKVRSAAFAEQAGCAGCTPFSTRLTDPNPAGHSQQAPRTQSSASCQGPPACQRGPAVLPWSRNRPFPSRLTLTRIYHKLGLLGRVDLDRRSRY
jgi:hypothetical protein